MVIEFAYTAIDRSFLTRVVSSASWNRDHFVGCRTSVTWGQGQGTGLAFIWPYRYGDRRFSSVCGALRPGDRVRAFFLPEPLRDDENALPSGR
jgi:hypothetical protein